MAWRGASALRSRQPRSTGSASSSVEEEVGDQRLRADRVQPELELGHDPEVAAASAQPPEQVGVLGLARADHVAVRGDHLERDDVVARRGRAGGRASPSRRRGSARRRRCATRCPRSSPGRAPAPPGRARRAARRPGPTRGAAPGSTRTPPIGVRSIISPPSGTASPTTLCPPQRTPISRSCSRANRTAVDHVADARAADDHRGRRSTIAFQTVRASSYPRSSGREDVAVEPVGQRSGHTGKTGPRPELIGASAPAAPARGAASPRARARSRARARRAARRRGTRPARRRSTSARAAGPTAPAKTAPSTAAPTAPPSARKKLVVAIATPSWRRSTPFCTATISTWPTMPKPRPKTRERDAGRQRDGSPASAASSASAAVISARPASGKRL